MPKADNSLPRSDAFPALSDSAGFWLFLFALFALVSLSLGESKIRKRMEIYHQRVAGAGDKEVQNNPAASSSTGTGDEIAVKNEPSYIYSLNGLRWIFGSAAVIGFIMLSWPFLRRKQASVGTL